MNLFYNIIIILRRKLQDKIESLLFKGKVIIIYGPGQVGKTTLIKEIGKKYPDVSLYLNCDEPDIREIFSKSATEIKNFIGNKRILFIDEAQRIKDVGLRLKILVDSFPDIQIVATGSSSFELSQGMVKPLTVRSYDFVIYPFSIGELFSIYSEIEVRRLVDFFLIYGMYPEIVLKAENRELNLKNLAKSYSYKDVLNFDRIKNPEVIQKLLQVLALQVGNEVSYNEVSDMVGVDKNTVASYVDILEKAFIIKRIGSFSRNLRNEIKKMKKIYFIDNGIRNAIINNLNDVSLKMIQDVYGRILLL